MAMEIDDLGGESRELMKNMRRMANGFDTVSFDNDSTIAKHSGIVVHGYDYSTVEYSDGVYVCRHLPLSPMRCPPAPGFQILTCHHVIGPLALFKDHPNALVVRGNCFSSKYKLG